MTLFATRHDGHLVAFPAVSLAMESPSIDPNDPTLVGQLAEASRDFDGTAPDPERNCWMAVHRHVHGVLPSEYDIREVPEALYLAVLARRKTLPG